MIENRELSPILQIKERLKNLSWSSFKTVATQFLSAFNLPDTSIARIVSQIKDISCGPIFVYRKAVLFCCTESSAGLFENQCVPYDKVPLVISITPDGLFWRDKDGILGFSTYNSLHLNVDSFLPLIVNDRNKKDYYITQDFGSIVASLYRSLKADGNSDQVSIRTVFNIIYISLFPTIENKSEVQNILLGNFRTCKERLDTLWSINQTNKFILEVDATISNDTFSYIKALLQNDKSEIDIEVLSSLVYKLLDKDDATLYGHQTSFINVQKVVNPLLLDQFVERLKEADLEEKKEIANEIINLSCLDPTNSPGSFLSAAYVGLIDILEGIDNQIGTCYANEIKICNFISIVDNEIAAELTRITLAYCKLSDLNNLSLTILNKVYDELSIHIDNPLYAQWEQYISNHSQVYIMGSPRFLGSQKLKKQKNLKNAVAHVYGHETGTVDYCSAWLIKAAKFINEHKAKAAFVLTNSIVQGVQVSEIWKTVYELECEIAFAYSSFKWKTSESTNVGVTVVVIGLQKRQKNKKFLFHNNTKTECNIIGPYLIPETEVIVEEEEDNLFGILPFIRKGNMAYDGTSKGPGKLLMDSYKEVKELEDADIRSSKYIKRIVGSEEFINAIRRWCIWIPSDDLPKEVNEIPLIMQRIENVREYRATSTATNKCKATPHKFRESYETSPGHQSLVIPSVSSENRPYIPVGFINDQIVVSNLAFCVYDCNIWVMAIISSRMHMLWIKTVCGALETRYRYSNTLGYNAFPIPYISDQNKEILKKLVLKLIEKREKYCDMSLGDLYNNMPDDLLRIHNVIDNTVDSLYRQTPFNDDGERISLLINMYQSKKSYE